MQQTSKVGNAIGWLLACLLAFVFVDVGYGKLVGQRVYVGEFARIGIGQWFRYFVGVLEVSGSIGAFVPRLRFWAALGLAVLMAGATIVNIAVLSGPYTRLAGLTIVLMVLALALAWLRRPSRAH